MTDLAAYLEDLLASGELMLGRRLPAERELALSLGCSRHALRQQLDLLERQGRITRTVGRGTFLIATPEPTDAPPRSTSPAAILEARMAWEPPLMTLVVVQATADDFAEVSRWLEMGAEAADQAAYEDADHGFHRALARAARNEVVTRLHELLEESRRTLTWGRMGQEIYTVGNWASCQQEHSDIVEALLDRDAELAATRMRAHLRSVRRQFLGDL